MTQHLTPGYPQMNSMSGSSVVHEQTVKAEEAQQHLPDPATVLPFTNQGMYCKSSDPHCNHQEHNLNYARLQEKEYNLHSFKGR